MLVTFEAASSGVIASEKGDNRRKGKRGSNFNPIRLEFMLGVRIFPDSFNV